MIFYFLVGLFTQSKTLSDPIRHGVNSIPELELKPNSNSGIGIAHQKINGIGIGIA
jgi:hypothetical protein